MAARKKKKRILSEEIAGIVLIALAILLGLGVYASGSGAFGLALRRICLGAFGVTAYLLPALLFVSGLYLLIFAERKIPVGKAVCWALVVLCAIGILHLFYTQRIEGKTFSAYINVSYEIGINDRTGGGALGALLAYPLKSVFGLVGAYIVNAAIILICILISTNFSIRGIHKDTSEKIHRIRESSMERRERKIEIKNHESIERAGQGQTRGGLHVFTMKEEQEAARMHRRDDDRDLTFIPGLPHTREYAAQGMGRPSRKASPHPFTLDGDEQDEAEGAQVVLPRQRKPQLGEQDTAQAVKETEEAVAKASKKKEAAPYCIPPLSMLPHASLQSSRGARSMQAEINANSALLERTFLDFDIQARVINVSVGPSITRYEIQPAAGVRVNRISNLQDDIALALAASGVRIEAPIPGKNAIGIEIPNKERVPVMLRELLEGEPFKTSKGRLSVVLGKDITGRHIVIDLSAMPHLLIAGTTGSGKSVCVNSMISSILFRSTPDEVKMIMIDPKVVEFTAYNGIPHLMIPVVTDVKKAAGALQWGVAEMLRRYNAFAEKGAKEIKRYNDILTMMDEKPLPYVVIFIDELADLMMAAPREVEDAICRIAQMGRAAGIHLVVATQRPSVDVITGLIKANFPSRIALTVSSATDSRTILNQSGAERLSGYGDMLFQSTATPKPIRIQGTLITDPEVEAVTNFLKTQNENAKYDESVIDHINLTANGDGKDKEKTSSVDEEEDLFNRAVEVFLDAGQGSTSLLQRRLRIGYGRAARLLDEMEGMGIIGPPDGPRPRKILITRAEFERQSGGRAEELG
jgi:S-DNA-T family DNA segregation ATPase FtsK/SpoIIIE